MATPIVNRYRILVQGLRTLRPVVKLILEDTQLNRSRMVRFSVLFAAIEDVISDLKDY